MGNLMTGRQAGSALGLQAETMDTSESSDAREQVADKPSMNQMIATNIKLILVVAVVAVVSVSAIIYYMSYSKENARQASLDLSRIRSYYEQGVWDKALNGDPARQIRGDQIVGLEEIVKEYGSSEAGRTAALYAASILVQQKKFNEAQEFFEHAADSKSAVVEIGGKAGLALCKEKNNDFLAAADLYLQAAIVGKSVGMDDKYDYYAAVNYEKANIKDKAIALYTELVMKNSPSEFSGEAKNSLARLGTIIE